METPKCFRSSAFFFIFIFIFLISTTKSTNWNSVQTKLEDPAVPMTVSSYGGGADIGGDNGEDGMDLEGDESGSRRSLLWPAVRYYISYASLSADRIPCPPRSGRSYYTLNCHLATGPVRPYYRGCSAITRCRR